MRNIVLDPITTSPTQSAGKWNFTQKTQYKRKSLVPSFVKDYLAYAIYSHLEIGTLRLWHRAGVSERHGEAASSQALSSEEACVLSNLTSPTLCVKKFGAFLRLLKGLNGCLNGNPSKHRFVQNNNNKKTP